MLLLATIDFQRTICIATAHKITNVEAGWIGRAEAWIRRRKARIR